MGGRWAGMTGSMAPDGPGPLPRSPCSRAPVRRVRGRGVAGAPHVRWAAGGPLPSAPVLSGLRLWLRHTPVPWDLQRASPEATPSHPGPGEEPQPVPPPRTPAVPEPEPRLPPQHHPEAGESHHTGAWRAGGPRAPVGGRGRRPGGRPGRCRPQELSERRSARQASSQSMPWLADLVQSSEGSLDVLPVQCLCEFLLHDAAADCPGEEEEEGESKEQKAKKRQVGAPAPPGPARPALQAHPEVPCPCRGSRSSGSSWAACRTCSWAPRPTSRPRARCWTTSCGAWAPLRWPPGCWP